MATFQESPRLFARRAAGALLLAGLALAAACAGHDPAAADADPAELEDPAGQSDPSAPAPAQGPGAGPSLDLGRVVDQIHFAFRPDAADPGAWTGGHTTYAVRADAGGFRVTPVTHEEGAPRRGAPGTFTTVAIGRASGLELKPARARALPAAAVRAVRAAGDGHLVLARADGDEHLRNGHAGVEQSFDFAAEPAGEGDLVVRVRVEGLRHAGETDGGHHFIDPESGLGLRYGVATWIDARGAATRVPVDWDAAGELALRVPEALVEASAYPAVLDPVISPELGMDQPVTGPSFGGQRSPEVAFDGTNFLVVWADQRSDLTDNFYYGTDIYGTRVTPGGVVLDPLGIPISTTYSRQDKPAVAWDGTSFLVAWRDERNVSSTRIYAARVSPGGAVLDPAGISLNPGVDSATAPSIAFNGTNHLVVWRGQPVAGGSSTLQGAFVSPGGAVTIAPAFTGVNGANPTVASLGGASMVVWSSSSTVRASRVSAAGAVLDPAGIAIGSGNYPRIATDGTQYAIAWLDSTTYAVRAMRVDATGSLLDASPLNLGVSTALYTRPGMAFDGTNYVVGWPTTAQQLAVRRLPPTGAPLAGTIVAGPSDTYAIPGLASGGGTTLVAWWRPGVVGGATQETVTTSRIDAAGQLLSPSDVPLAAAVNRQVAPDAAFDGTNYLVVWEDTRADGDRDVYGARVTPTGAILDPSGIAVADAAGNQAAPRVVFDGTNHLVVWQDSRNAATGIDIYAAQVTPGGAVLPANPLCTASANQTYPDVATGSGATLVAWTDARNGGSTIYAARVANGLSLDGNGFGVTAQSGFKPAVDFGQGQFFVGWSSGSRIYGSRVGADGVVLDAAALQLATLYYTGTEGPGVAFDGTHHLVAWHHTASALYQIRARKVPTSGAPLADFAIQSTAGDSGAVAVGFDGLTPVIAWERPTLTFTSVVAARLLPSGAMAPPGVLNIEVGYGPSRGPSIATNGAGQSLVTYAQFDPAAGLGAYRARGRFISLSEPGAACASALDCASGFCVDGVCCSSACGGGSAADCQACSVAAGAATDGTCAPLSGTACNDDSACTQTDTCQAGACTGGNPVVCAAPDSCHVGVCNPANGACSVQQKPDGAACDDGSACTQLDTCQAGACAGQNPVVCPAPTLCHASACDPASGACMAPPLPDGTACNDGSACTQTDVCQAGTCTGGNPVVCAPPDGCHEIGACDPASGQCTYVPKANGAACDDGNACTQADTCQAGACTAGSPVTCAAPDACHEAGVCNPASGQCAYAPKPNGAACDDGDACTQADTCQAGACTGADPVFCAPSDDCHAAACDSATGQCAETPVPDGAACPGGICVGGTCQGGAGGGGGGTTTGTGGGSPGTGGSSPGTGGGSPGTGGSSGDDDDDDGGSSDDGGCGCRTAPSAPATRGAPLALLALALVARRRRDLVGRCPRAGRHRLVRGAMEGAPALRGAERGAPLRGGGRAERGPRGGGAATRRCR